MRGGCLCSRGVMSYRERTLLVRSFMFVAIPSKPQSVSDKPGGFLSYAASVRNAIAGWDRVQDTTGGPTSVASAQLAL
jgi:hypothetical protein